MAGKSAANRERPAGAGVASKPLLLALLLIIAGILLSMVVGGSQAQARSQAAVTWAKVHQAFQSPGRGDRPSPTAPDTPPASREWTRLAEDRRATCNVTLAIPKLALLFLTRGPMPHREVWGRWFQSVAGLVPKSALLAPRAVCLRKCTKAGCVEDCGPQAACYPQCAAALQAAYAARPRGWGHLLSVYTHAAPAWGGYQEASPFRGTLIKARIPTAWGTHSLMEAARRLVAAAVADPANRWFVLASETAVPLYSPLLVWQQLAHESLSRIDACTANETETMIWRASPHMATARFDPKAHWRKSGQWWTLQRRHAELVAGDREVSASFAARCKDGRDEELNRWRDCISDEHYVPSLLAMHGQDNQTTCDSKGGTFTSWQPGATHPDQFLGASVSRGLLDALRGEECAPLAAEASEAAEEAFLRVASLSSQTCISKAQPSGWLRAQSRVDSATMPVDCNFLARKLGPDAVLPLLQLYTDCDSKLGIIPCNSSSGGQTSWEQVLERWLPGR